MCAGPPALESRGDDGDPDLVAERVVDHRAEDDVRLGVRGLLYQRGGLVDLEQPEVGTARDRQQYAVRAVHRRLQQRRIDRLLGGLHDRPSPRADPIPISAGPAPDMTHLTSAKSRLIRPGVVISRDALNTVEQHLVGRTEGVHQGDGDVAELQQPVVRDHDQGVALVAQRLDAVLGLLGAPLALEGERAGDDAYGQRAELAGDAATTGAPPVPVPPPSPAVTKTMSAPLRTSSISSVWSSAALRPTSGSRRRRDRG